MSNKRLPPNKLIEHMAETLQYTLEEIQERIMKNEGSDFILGERTVIVEYLELIQKRWKYARKFGLDYNIEKKYPL